MTVKVRFAPSPTGKLHVGNLRTALFNKLLALHTNGIFMLRIDDTDEERSTKENEESIKRDLEWLGLNWQETANQWDRMERYVSLFDELYAKGFVYACYETAEELEYKRKRLLNRGLPPVYDRSALQLTTQEIADFEKEGRKPYFRFKLPDEPMEFDDIVRGSQHFEAGHISDPVIRRANGNFLYMLPSVIDDIDFNITHIIRGEDHTSNTALQTSMFMALGGSVPQFAHLPLMVGEDGDKLSKRIGSLGVGQLREQGIEANALNSYLTSLGHGTPDYNPNADLHGLAKDFDLTHYARNTPRFDPMRLWDINQHIIQAYNYDEVSARLSHLSPCSEAFWLAVRENCKKLQDADNWHNIIYGNITADLSAEDKEFVQKTAEYLPSEPYNLETWAQFTNAVKDALGRKGKALFMPLRIALTGEQSGPELKHLLPLIGKENACKRLKLNS